MEYFASIGMNPDINSQSLLKSSIIHAAIYSKDIRSLKFVLDRLKCSPNIRCSEGSPLKVAMSSGNIQVIELLISRGAYYIYKNVYSNITPLSALSSPEAYRDGYHYTSLLTGKPVYQISVMTDRFMKPSNSKTCLQWIRIKPLMNLRRHAKTKSKRPFHRFKSMAEILTNNIYFDLILKMCVGDGSSLLPDKEGWEEQIEFG